MNGMNRSTGQALEGVAHLKQSIQDILTTPIGSRVMRRDYGSRLFQLIDNPVNSETIADIVAATAEALGRWESRILVQKVVISSAKPGAVVIDLQGVYRPDGRAITLDGIEVS